MADFRRWILALAMLVLVLGSVAPASAQVQQAFACTANAAVPPTIRQEGITELTGDIVLNCVGGTPTPTGTPIPTANFTVFLTNPITSRVLSAPITEALLLIDEPTVSQQKVCTNPTNPTASCAAVGSAIPGSSFATNGDFNTYQGIVTGPNAITFLGVPVDAPTSPSSPARIFRMTNIRANASTSPVNVAGVSYVQAFISASSSTSVPINNPSPIVGFIAKGLNFSAVGSGQTFLQCESASSATVATLTYTENFATAFKNRVAQIPSTVPPQGVPGQIYNTESGLIQVSAVGNTSTIQAGLADWGTRFSATFSNLPSGISLAVDAVASSPSGTTGQYQAVFIGTSATVADPSPYGQPAVPATPVDLTPSIVYASGGGSTGTVTAVWEVISDNPSAIDTFAFNVYLTYTGAPGNPGSPTVSGTALPNVVGGFAPTSSNGTWPYIPVFVPPSAAPTNLFSVAICQTILLFPYVTDFPGFDTGIAIGNTSKDSLPAGMTASQQSGPCTVSFFGGVGSDTGFTDTSGNIGTSGVYSTTAANTFGTGVIGPGQTWAFELAGIDTSLTSSTFMGFTGYAIAICNFQYAHGYAFVSDYGLNKFSTSYVALVIPDAARTATANICSASAGTFGCAPTGEQLEH